MADPGTLAIGSMGAGAFGSILQAFGSSYSGQAQSNLYNYQAGIAQANATLAKQDANYALASGEVSAQQAGMKGRAQMGATRVGFGAGNVAGSSVNAVEGSETEITQQNEALIRANAAKRAYGFNVEGAKDVAQAGVYGVAAATSQTAGQLGAISSIIGGAGGVASKWLQYKQYFGSGSGGGGGSPTTSSELSPDVFS